MQTSGYGWGWTVACSGIVFAGSLQFLMVSFFAGSISLATVTVMALLLNSRHIFYGIPFIEKWRDYGKAKAWLIFALPDEAFSLHCSNDFDDGNETHKKWSYLLDATFVYLYWVILSLVGALVGRMITFNTAGIDFSLTALFIVILMEQIREARNLAPAVIAFVSSLACLAIFGASDFILPSLLITTATLILFRKKVTE